MTSSNEKGTVEAVKQDAKRRRAKRGGGNRDMMRRMDEFRDVVRSRKETRLYTVLYMTGEISMIMRRIREFAVCKAVEGRRQK